MHWKVPSGAKGATCTLVAKRPCSIRCLRLCSESLDCTSPASGGGSGHPSAGQVLGQQNLCSRVPTAPKQSWHLLSSVSNAGTDAFLACGHCPPHTAEARSPLHLLFQLALMSPAALPQPLPLIRELMALVQGTRMDL